MVANSRETARMVDPAPRLLLDGLAFPEGPRWHDDRLWFSDVLAGEVLAVDLRGDAERIVEVPALPSGLGWLPDGRLLVVSVDDRRLLRLEAGVLVEHADLSRLASYGCNDMAVDASGHAWVGACDNAGIPTPALSELLVVDPDGAARVVDGAMAFPNGAVITPDQSTLIVAETFGARLTAFSLDGAGAATGRRVWADLGRGVPDGIALDAEGAVWYADPVANECVRVREGGEVVARVSTPQPCFACALGGPDGTTLFLLTSGSTDHVRNRAERPGRISTVEVDVAAA